jgi:hypothetical protein
MSGLRGVPGISGHLIWVRQIEHQTGAFMKRCVRACGSQDAARRSRRVD